MQEYLDELVRNYTKAFHLPGVSVGVYSKGQEWFAAAGRRQGGAVDQQTIYPIGSTTKAFIAAVVMQLHEEGRLDLDDPVVRYLPSFALNTAERTEALTIRDTLCHRCGLPRHSITLMTNQHCSLNDMVYKIRYLEPVWPARQRFYYQNHMFAVATQLVEQLTGLPWGEAVRQRIFDPLGMTHTYTRSLAYEEVEQNYARARVGLRSLNIPVQTMLCDSTGGAGAISSNARDMLRWVTANLHQGSYAGGRLFSEDSDHELHGCQMPINEGEMFPYQLPEVTSSSYGLGWFVDTYQNERMLHHGGTITGFKSQVGFLPEHDFAFCVLANRDNTLAVTAIGNALCDYALGLPPEDWSQRFLDIHKQLSDKAKATYRATTAKPHVKQDMPEDSGGIYRNEAYGTLRIEERGNRLSLHIAGLKIPIVPARDEFALNHKVMGLAFACRFELDENSRPRAFLAHLEEELESYIRFERIG